MRAARANISRQTLPLLCLLEPRLLRPLCAAAASESSVEGPAGQRQAKNDTRTQTDALGLEHISRRRRRRCLLLALFPSPAPLSARAGRCESARGAAQRRIARPIKVNSTDATDHLNTHTGERRTCSTCPLLLQTVGALLACSLSGANRQQNVSTSSLSLARARHSL